MTEQPRFHRFRHYPNTWSNFDLIEECTKPNKPGKTPCIGCMFNHPFCDKNGRVTTPAEQSKESDK